MNISLKYKPLSICLLVVCLALAFQPPYIPPLPENGAIVVSGAGSGIGLHVAKRLVKEFAPTDVKIYGLIRSDRHIPTLEKLQITPILADLKDDESLQNLTTDIAEPIVGFFDSAGIAVPNVPMEFIDIDYMEQIYQVDVFGLTRVLQKVIPSMRNHPGSRMVLLGSVSGAVTPSFMGMDPAKSIEVLADATRRELKPYKIGVSVVQAGFVASPIIEKTMALDKSILTKKMVEIYPHLKAKDYGEQVQLDDMAPMSVVGDAVVGAFRNTRPKIRYVVGSVPSPVPTRLLVALLHLLPHHIIDLFD